MALQNRERSLSREISATQIPSGDRQVLPAGTKLQLQQTLGGSYTVLTDFGLFRIDGKDGDALGEKAADHSVAAATLEGGAPRGGEARGPPGRARDPRGRRARSRGRVGPAAQGVRPGDPREHRRP